MKNQHRNNSIYTLLTMTLFVFGCSFGNTKAEKNIGNNSAQFAETEIKIGVSSNQTPLKKQPAPDAASIAGNYEYDTYKDGEGYKNTLEVTVGESSKLNVYISGAYNYTINGNESFHEAEGKGDAVLKGDTALATLVDEEGKPCRATIIFRADTAAVKIPDTCQFNIALDGVYKKIKADKAKSLDDVQTENKVPHRIKYSELMTFVDDAEVRETGEEFIITNVSPAKLDKKIPADKDGSADYRNLFYLEETDDEGYIGNALLVSKTMLDSLDQTAKSRAVSLRLTATLIESKGKYDVYRMALVTRIEGLKKDGSVMWTADGGKPLKIRFVH